MSVVPLLQPYRLRPHEQSGEFYTHDECDGIGHFQLRTDGAVVCAVCGEELHSLRVSLVDANNEQEASDGPDLDSAGSR